jgi:hypothetical protein
LTFAGFFYLFLALLLFVLLYYGLNYLYIALSSWKSHAGQHKAEL